MVLVDSGAWVAFLCNKSPFVAEVRQLSQQTQALGHELVYGELLMGDVRVGRRLLLGYYRKLTYAPTLPHAAVEHFVREHSLTGRGIGWIDAHLAAVAFSERVPLYTNDGPLRAVAEELGILYHEGQS